MKKICIQCGKLFYVEPSRIKSGRGKFCSRQCIDNNRKNNIECVCENCGKKYQVNATQNGKKYCCFKCYLEKRKIIKGKEHYNWGRHKIIKCGYCGKNIQVPMYRIKNNRGKFCSKDCYHNSSKKSYEHKLKTYRKNTEKCRFGRERREILQLFNNKCCVCSSKEDLVIHHKDMTGYKSIGTYIGVNNKLPNLEVYCRSCHTKIHNQMSKI